MSSKTAKEPFKEEDLIDNMSRLGKRAQTSSIEYEFQVAALVEARAREMGLECDVYSNVTEAKPCDDIVVKIRKPEQALLLIQLKCHQRSRPLEMQAFAAESGDYAISKYYDYFKKYNDHHKQDNKSILFEYPRENVRIIICTTKAPPKQSNKGKQKEAKWKELGFSVDELLNTNTDSAGNMICFGKGDSEIWDLMDQRGEEEREDYQNNFLPQFRMYCNQANPDEIKNLIRKSLRSAFCGCLPESVVKELPAFFLDELKEWARDNNARSVGEENGPLAKAMARALRPKMCGIGKTDLIFNDSALKPLENIFLQGSSSKAGTQHQNQKIMLINEANEPDLFQRLRLFQFCRREYPDSWVFIEQESLDEFKMDTLKLICSACTVIVLEKIQSLHKSSEQIDVISKNCRMLVVLDLPGRHQTIPKSWKKLTLQEGTTWTDLSEKTQEAILDHSVSFQGTKMNLRDIHAKWPSFSKDVDGTFLKDVLEKRATIGTSLVEKEEEKMFKMKRRFCHSILLPPEAPQKLTELGYIVAISNCPPELQDGRWIVLSERGKAASAEVEFLKFNNSTMNTRQRRHLLHSVGNIFEFRISLGPGSNLQTLVELPGDLQNLPINFENPCPFGDPRLCKQFVGLKIHDEESLVKSRGSKLVAALLGEAGSGKSFFLRNAATESRKSQPQLWAILVRVIDHQFLFKRMQDKVVTVEHVEELLAKAAGVNTDVGLKFLKTSLWDTGNISVYVDGVDELCPEYRDIIFKLLQLLLTAKIKQLWVSSRLEEEDSLCNLLDCICIYPKPLSPEEQISFMSTSWVHTCNTQAQKFTSFAGSIVNIFGGVYDVLSNPLLVCIATKVFESEAKVFIREQEKKSKPVVKKISLLSLYQRFFEQMRNEYLDRQGIAGVMDTLYGEVMLNYDMEVHEQCAMFLLIISKKIMLDLGPFLSFIKQHSKELEKQNIGIMCFNGFIEENPHITFFHFTFVEYFAACWLFKNLSNPKVKENLKRLYIIETRQYFGVSYFLDMLLVKDNPVLEAIYSGDSDAVDKALTQPEILTVKDGLGRTALHLAVRQLQVETVEKLLKRGFDVHTRDGVLQQTALEHTGKGNITDILKISELLLDHNADPNDLELLIVMANINPQIPVLSLQEKCLKVFHHLIKIIQKETFSIALTSLIGHSVRSRLHDTLNLIYERCVRENIEFDPLPIIDQEGNHMLHIAVSNSDEDMVEFLLKIGKRKDFYLHVLKSTGETLLHVAAEQGNLNIVRLLMKHGANPNIPLHGKGNMTPAKLARKNKFKEIVRVLEKAERRSRNKKVQVHVKKT